MITVTLPLNNADALLRLSDMCIGLAKDARAKEPLPQNLELREGLTTTEAPLPTMPTAPKSEPEPYAPDFDADGLPWDERIHSSNRKLTAQGVWQRRRNVSDELYNSVMAELTGNAPDQDGGDNQYERLVEDMAAEELAAITPPPPPPAPSAEPMTFADLIKEITENQINPDRVLKAVQSVGLANAGELFARPDLIPQVARELGLES